MDFLPVKYDLIMEIAYASPVGEDSNFSLFNNNILINSISSELYSPNDTLSDKAQIGYSSLDFNKLNNYYSFISFTIESEGLFVIECLNNECSTFKGPLKITEDATGLKLKCPSSVYIYNSHKSHITQLDIIRQWRFIIIIIM